MTETADSLFDTLTALQAEKSRPPVHDWHPERQGRIDIRIAADGTWYHEGAPIQRSAMVRLFASVLRRDDDGYCLVTPAERLLIEVEDAPFLAVDLQTTGEGAQRRLLLTTNVDDHVLVDREHPLRVEDRDGEPRPYLHVHDGLDALLSRNLFYQLVELAEAEAGELVVYSDGERFSLGAVQGS